MTQFPRLLALALCLLCLPAFAAAQSVINFDDENAGAGAVNVTEFDVLTNQFASLGVTFASSGNVGRRTDAAPTPGALLPEGLTRSGGQALMNSVTDPLTGDFAFVPVELVFSAPVTDFGGYFVNLGAVTFTGFDAAGGVAASGALDANADFTFFGFGATPLSRVLIASDFDFVLDDLQFTAAAVAPIPEPTTLALLAISAAAVALARRRRRGAETAADEDSE